MMNSMSSQLCFCLLENQFLVSLPISEMALTSVNGCNLQNSFAPQVKRKKAAHAGMFDLAKTANRPMIHIGG